MIDHNFTHYGLNENYTGEVTLPSENGNVKAELSLRHFVQLSRRAYSHTALENLVDSEGIILTKHETPDDVSDTVPPFFHIKLTIQPDNQTLTDFAESDYGNSFFDTLLELVGKSSVRRLSGNRIAFVGTFNKAVDAIIGEVFVSDLFIGTSVFFNDYRVTTNFPANESEESAVVEGIFRELTKEFPDVKIELSID
jgi:hypothetical protein